MNEVVAQGKNDLISADDVEMIRRYDEISKRYKMWVSANKEMFENFMVENGLDTYEQGGVRITRVKGYTKKQVDTQALKDAGIYDNFTRDVNVKESIRVEVEYD